MGFTQKNAKFTKSQFPKKASEFSKKKITYFNTSDLRYMEGIWVKKYM